MTGHEGGDGTAGASARREHARRKGKREADVRSRHPRIGGVLLALGRQPQHETAWASGAVGEEMVQRALARRCPQVTVLHDRRVPGTRANIDHIAIAATGVWVIDTKHYKDQKVEVTKPLFGAAKLKVGRRDRTRLVEGLAAQVELVEDAVWAAGLNVPVTGCFCFVQAELPLVGTPSISGFDILNRRGLVKRLRHDGPMAESVAAAVTAQLRESFPPA